MELLSLPDCILERITSQLDCYEAMWLKQTCHKMDKLISEMQPPMTVLDTKILKPTFKVKLDSVVPLIHILECEWDEWGDAIMKRLLLKKKRASQSIGKGLAKVFSAWTKTQEAQDWQEFRPGQHLLINYLQNIGCETAIEPSDKPLDEFIECHLNIPNVCWDVDNRCLQKHFSTVMQPLVNALTSFVQDMVPIVPHIAVFISNYEPAIPLPKYKDPPPWTCHSQLETPCTCGDPIGDCVIRRRWGSDLDEDEIPSAAIGDEVAEFASQSSSEFEWKWGDDTDSD